MFSPFNFRSIALAGVALVSFLSSRTHAQTDLPNLNSTPTAVRFNLTDRVWPANPGDASICLWEDDKFAALTFTVDDNSAPDIPWWLGESERYGFRVTWFVITGRVDGSNSYFGTWALYNQVRNIGHDVQSHTVLHLDTSDPSWSGIEAEYGDSKAAIVAHMAGNRTDFLAYPGGTNSYLNDRTIADDYYAAVRGTAGTINTANKIDYLNTCGMSSFSIGSGGAWADLESLFNPADLRYYRGWAVLIYHKVNYYNAVQPVFDFLAAHRSDLWTGNFGEVALYGQERDTTTLTVTGTSEAQITLTLTDQMLDSRFDYPLTIKVRLPANWNSVVATQNGQRIDADFLRHNGSPYALVKAVPDRGLVVIKPASAPLPPGRTYDQWLRRYALPLDHSSLGAENACPAGDGIQNFQKFSLGLDPRSPGDGGHLRYGTTVSGSQKFLTFTYQRPYPPPVSVDYKVEMSTDLIAWSEPSTSSQSAIADGIETVTVQDTTSIDAWGRRFVRLRLAVPSP